MRPQPLNKRRALRQGKCRLPRPGRDEHCLPQKGIDKDANVAPAARVDIGTITIQILKESRRSGGMEAMVAAPLRNALTLLEDVDAPKTFQGLNRSRNRNLQGKE